MDCMTFCALRGSLSPNNWPKVVGIICQDTPNLSFSQPQGPGSPPPAESFSHSSSTSACVSQLTKSEKPWAKVKLGPPFRAINSCPSSTKVADMTAPPSPYRLM